MSLAPGDRVSHYRIEAVLGSGGNGVVYRARDERLDRTVALKLLHLTDTDADGERQRLLREARAAAALDHRNICVIHEVGEHDGRPFIAMQYIEGETLQARIARGPVPPAEARRYALQIADALAAAHALGIVHRDLKPSNLMLAGDKIKLLDFGLAKSVPQPAERSSNRAALPTLTDAGMLVGTAGYMAPEQLLGARVDARGDIFSFGVVLYETLSGQSAFQRDSQEESRTAVLERDLPPLRTLVPGLPAEFERIVGRCLEISPSARYQSAVELLSALRRVVTEGQPVPMPGLTLRRPLAAGSGRKRANAQWLGLGLVAVSVLGLWMLWSAYGVPEAVLPSEGLEAVPVAPEASTSIAVLPFLNLSAEQDNEYFADGISEELLNVLARIEGLRVTSRTSAFAFKGKDTPLPDIARQLGVRHVLEGSVRRQGQRVRINVQLIRADADMRLWSNIYDDELTDIFRVQEDIARAIATELAPWLDSRRVAVVASTGDLDAYQRFLRGRARFHRRESLPAAINDLEFAVTQDAQFAEAWAYLAATHLVAPGYAGAQPPELHAAEAQRAVERGRERAPEHPILLAVQGELALARRDALTGWRAQQAAVKHAGQDSTPFLWHGQVLLSTGYIEPAIATLEQAVRMDPLSAVNLGWLGIALLCGDREAEAEQRIREAAAREWRPGGWLRVIDLAVGGERERAAESFRALADADDFAGDRAAVTSAFLRALRDPAHDKRFRELRDADELPEDLLALGDADALLEWLLAATAHEGEVQTWWLRSAWLPSTRHLREDPRFFTVAERMGLLRLWESEGYPAGCRRLDDSNGPRLECPAPQGS